MPKFIFRKLVRDKLPDVYTELDQKAEIRRVKGVELWRELKRKFIEEASELPSSMSEKEVLTNEFGDLLRIIKDSATLAGIDFADIEDADAAKTTKKGGFLEGMYIKTLELKEDDSWNDYYRKEPERFPELTSGMITFVTGNADKAAYLEKMLGVPVLHHHAELDEIQSLSLEEIVMHKVKQAYDIVKSPVLVEDVSLALDDFGGLPGPFIKFFVNTKDGLEKLCRTADALPSRGAVAACVFGYFDGERLELMRGELHGTIANHPRGTDGFGWDVVFCPDGFGGKTRAELTPSDDVKTYATIKPFARLRDFLQELQ